MSNLEQKIFGKKTLSTLFGEIYENQKKKETQISSLINELKPLITDIGDATLIVPLLKDYLELGIKNDEQLIKMATIIQRSLNSTAATDEDFGLSDAEKQQLFTQIEKFKPNKDDI